LSIEILVGIILVLLFSALGLLLWRRKKPNQTRIIKDRSSKTITPQKICPLCRERLERGLRVHSALFPGKEFDLMHIFGCRYCWSSEGASISASTPHKTGSSSAHHKISRGLNNRHCPCCKLKLPEDGYVMARVYRKPYRPPHVHVYGCTSCDTHNRASRT